VSGSCSDGRPRDWECPPPPEPDLTASGDGQYNESEVPPGLDEYDQQIVIQKVAQSLKNRGEGAGGWQEFVDEILEPKLDPRRLIMRAVSKHVENILAGGNGRYSYRRPSRRPSHGGLIRPRSFQPIPRITLIVDTSGSMSSSELGVAVGLVSKVLDGLRLRDGLQVVCGDTQVQSAEKIFDPSKIKLAGRGGTDMRTLVTAAVEEKPEPDLILLVTDGWTPWPEQTKMPVVACITPGGKTHGIPAHIETVQLAV
jgi:predicted metal-dependent peptidase